jgi:hypothetical protein
VVLNAYNVTRSKFEALGHVQRSMPMTSHKWRQWIEWLPIAVWSVNVYCPTFRGNTIPPESCALVSI